MLRMLLAILSVTAGNAATFATIYQFGDSQTPQAYPYGTLVKGGHGLLYGTAALGGPSNSGMVFSLSPPASPGGLWTETVLYVFGTNAGDGSFPAGVVAGPGGTLYGA